MRQTKKTGGFTLFELIITVIALCILTSVAYMSYARLATSAEIARQKATLSILQGQLDFDVAVKHAKGLPIDDIANANPFNLIGRTPPNYGGEITAQALATDQLTRGSWYFVADRGWLIYHIDHYNHYRSDYEIPNVIRYHLVRSNQHERLHCQKCTEYEFISLKPLDSYQWR